MRKKTNPTLTSSSLSLSSDDFFFLDARSRWQTTLQWTYGRGWKTLQRRRIEKYLPRNCRNSRSRWSRIRCIRASSTRFPFLFDAVLIKREWCIVRCVRIREKDFDSSWTRPSSSLPLSSHGSWWISRCYHVDFRNSSRCKLSLSPFLPSSKTGADFCFMSSGH